MRCLRSFSLSKNVRLFIVFLLWWLCMCIFILSACLRAILSFQPYVSLSFACHFTLCAMNVCVPFFSPEFCGILSRKIAYRCSINLQADIVICFWCVHVRIAFIFHLLIFSYEHLKVACLWWDHTLFNVYYAWVFCSHAIYFLRLNRLLSHKINFRIKRERSVCTAHIHIIFRTVIVLMNF